MFTGDGKPLGALITPDKSVAAILAAAGFLILAGILVGLNFRGWRERLFGETASIHIQSLAVLPLENFSRDPDQFPMATMQRPHRRNQHSAFIAFARVRHCLPHRGKNLHPAIIHEPGCQATPL